jgi:UDP-N-acetylmuramoylalanine--D-glutamate ligase
MRLDKLEGLRLGIAGFGVEGQSAARLLTRLYPNQALTIFLPEAPSTQLQLPTGTQLVCGELTPETLAGCDVLIKSPGVSLYQPGLQAAIAAGLQVTSGSQLWFAETWPSRIVIVSGSKGKSTTCALTVFLLQAAGYTAQAAGNFGVSLLDLWQEPELPEFLIIELSSYQTADFEGRAEIALLTNLFPEHTDWHGSVENYYRDKLKLFERPSRLNLANHRDAESRARLSGWDGFEWFNNEAAWWVSDAGVFHNGLKIAPAPQWPLYGDHNLINLSAALSIVNGFDVDVRPGIERLGEFHGLPHRLQSIGEVGGVRLIDDSISTAPQATVAALKALGSSLTSVIVGGFDRDIDWAVFADHLQHHPVHRVITQGDNGPRIADLLQSRVPQQDVTRAADLADAVEQGLADAAQGGLLLLSPGAPSFGQFDNYRQRGKQFARLAGVA